MKTNKVHFHFEYINNKKRIVQKARYTAIIKNLREKWKINTGESIVRVTISDKVFIWRCPKALV